jgi:macrodomain Ter protein organizer (MatP/YcbG family)
MPYKVEKEGEEYLVINTESGETKARHATKEAADNQVALLHEIENDPDFKEGD